MSHYSVISPVCQAIDKTVLWKQSLQILEIMMANKFVSPPEFVQGWGVTLCLSLQCPQLLDIILSTALNIQGEDSFQKKHLSKSTLDEDTCNIV